MRLSAVMSDRVSMKHFVGQGFLSGISCDGRANCKGLTKETSLERGWPLASLEKVHPSVRQRWPHRDRCVSLGIRRGLVHEPSLCLEDSSVRGVKAVNTVGSKQV